MQAICYNVNPVGWGTCWWLKRFWRGCLLSPLAGLSLQDVEPQPLCGDDWVRVRTILAGICGTDVGILAQKQLPNSILQAFSSMPMILGHENVCVVEEIGSAVDPSWIGRRVCVEPALCCAVRGIDPPCPRCAAGQFGSCDNFGADGLGRYGIPPGTSIGYNSRTGGAFAESFVAHFTQLVPVPKSISDEQALLTDPIACSLHAVLQADLAGARRVLVYGAGVIGLGVIASLRATGFSGHIDTLDRCEYLARPAERLGADQFLRLPATRGDRFEYIARRTEATVQRARFGNYMLSGGYDVVFDCVGVEQSINECLKWTRSRGQMVMVGTGHGGAVDLTPIWFAELTILGAYGRQIENFNGSQKQTYEVVHDLMQAGKLETRGLITHKFPLSAYRKALSVAMDKAPNEAIKVAFDFR